MRRPARWLQDNLDRIPRIYVTVDSHQPFDIAHPTFWRNADGAYPSVMTIIELNDEREGH